MAAGGTKDECSICKGELQDARILPCIHSFCRQCLEQYCESINKLPGDDVSCPECRNKFDIPKGGVAGLTVRTEIQCRGNEHMEQVKSYCCNCQVNVCSKCCFQAHKDHSCQGIDDVAQKFATSIDRDIQEVTLRVESFRGVAAQVEAESTKLLGNVKAAEQEIKDRGTEVKQHLAGLIDRKVNNLLQELQSLTAEEESDSDRLRLTLAEMESLRKSLSELRANGSPSDITQAAGGLLARAQELLQKRITPSEYRAPSYKFTPVNLDDSHNFVGHVVTGDDRGEAGAGQGTSSQQQQQQQQQQYYRQWLGYDARVTKQLSVGDGEVVLGVTSVGDELFALLRRNVDQVAVYSIDDYQLLRHLLVPGLHRNDCNDITSSVPHKCLYMSDCDNSCIHRYNLILRRNLRNVTKKWPVPAGSRSLRGVSVTPSGSLLVTCCRPSKLVELSADSGQCVREITLQLDVLNPWHSVQLTTGQFVVCHGFWDDNLHRVCVVDDDGRVVRSYGGRRGSDVGQLRWPRHLAVDRDSQFLFVTDEYSNRVVLLSPTLEFVHNVVEKLTHPRRLHLHQSTRRLFVGLALYGCTVVHFADVTRL